MRPLTVVFIQPALGDFPCFIQCSEQVKIQYFCSECPMNRSIKMFYVGLYLVNFSNTMLLCPLCQPQRDHVIHPRLQRITPVCHDPVQHSHDPMRRNIQLNFDRQCFAAGILNGASGLDRFQNGNDLVFGESGFAHGDLPQGHNQYAGRSLKMNGSFKQDTNNIIRGKFTI